MTGRAGRPLERREFLLHGARAAGLGLAAVAGADGLLRLLDRAPPADLSGASAIAALPAPGIVTRSQWGADESLRSGTPSFAELRKIVLHHTVEPDGSGDGATEVRNIYEFHTRHRGWNDIGYNFVIDPGGAIYEGRWARPYDRGEVHSGENRDGETVVGAHVASNNTGTAGIAFLADFRGSHPTAAALESAIQLVAWLCARHGIDPRERAPFTNSDGDTRTLPNVLGHRDIATTNPTSCPADLTELLPEIRRKAALSIADGFVGYRIVSSRGRVAHRGGARDYGDLASFGLSGVVAGAAGQPDRQGYWVVDRGGGVFSFGGARYHGSVAELRRQGHRIGSSETIGVAATRSGRGYWLYDADGGIFTFGDASFHGSVPGLRAQGHRIGRARIVSMAPTPSGGGYWVLDEHGGTFSFGDASFHGSVPELRAQGHRVGRARIVSMAPTPSGGGYWVIDEHGGIFSFGDASFHGSLPERGIGDHPVRGIVAAPSGRGYVVLTASGAIYAFGAAPFHGRWSPPAGTSAVALAPVIRR